MGVADFVIKLVMDTTGVSKGSDKAKAEIKNLASKLEGGVEGIKGFGMGLAKMFAVPTAALGIGKFFLDAAHNAAELKKEASGLDTTVGMVKALHKASTLTRTPFESVQTGLEHTRKSQSEALQGDKGKIEDFARLGVSLKDLENLSGDQLFLKIADGVEKGSINAANFSSFLAVMGKQANDLVPAFKDGFATIANSIKASGTELVNALDEADKGWVRLKSTAGGFFKFLATQVAGGLLSLGKLTGAAASLLVAATGINSKEEAGRAVNALTDRELMNDPDYGASLDVTQQLEQRLKSKLGIKDEKGRKAAEDKKRDREEAKKLALKNVTKLNEMRIGALGKGAEEIALKKRSAELLDEIRGTAPGEDREKLRAELLENEGKLAAIKPEMKGYSLARPSDSLSKIGLFRGGAEANSERIWVEQLQVQRLALSEQRRTVQRLDQLRNDLTSYE